MWSGWIWRSEKDSKSAIPREWRLRLMYWYCIRTAAGEDELIYIRVKLSTHLQMLCLDKFLIKLSREVNMNMKN